MSFPNSAESNSIPRRKKLSCRCLGWTLTIVSSFGAGPLPYSSVISLGMSHSRLSLLTGRPPMDPLEAHEIWGLSMLPPGLSGMAGAGAGLIAEASHNSKKPRGAANSTLQYR